MKKVLYTTILAVSMLFISCENTEDDLVSLSDSGWVEFTSASSLAVYRADAPSVAEVTVRLPIGSNENGLDVSYTATVTQGTTQGNTGLGAQSINISPSGKEATIRFDVLPSTANYVIEFAINGVSNSNYQIGLSDGSKIVMHTLTVCPLSVGTTYNASVQVPDIGVDSTNNAPFAYTATLTPVMGQAFTWDIDSAWGPNFVALLTGNPGFAGLFTYPATLVLNPDTNEVTVIGDGNFFTGGSGTYDPCTDTFAITISQDLFNGDFTVDTTLTGI